jgi:glycosyltransferase involved in cell wall biosynthesis
MRVFLAGTSFRPAYGGPAFSVARLAAALVASGVEVGVWSPDGSVAEREDLRARPGLLPLVGAAQEALRAVAPVDLIHDNGLWLRHNHQLAALGARGRIPRLVSTRGMLEPWALRHKRWKKRLAWALYQRRDLRRAACLHVTAAPEAGHVQGLGLGVPVRLVPNGVEVPAAPLLAEGALGGGSGVPGAARTALFLGRLYPVKGLPMLLDAWRQVRPPGWHLLLAGPDEAGHQALLEQQVRALGLEAVVAFAGAVAGEAKMRTLLGAELFILPSYTESFGLAAAEALAHGLPVLTTTGTPWTELPRRGCGWLAAPTADALAAALREATAQPPAVLQAMGARGRAWMAADFAWSQVAAAMRSVYEAVLAGAG